MGVPVSEEARYWIELEFASVEGDAACEGGGGGEKEEVLETLVVVGVRGDSDVLTLDLVCGASLLTMVSPVIIEVDPASVE